MFVQIVWHCCVIELISWRQSSAWQDNMCRQCRPCLSCQIREILITFDNLLINYTYVLISFLQKFYSQCNGLKSLKTMKFLYLVFFCSDYTFHGSEFLECWKEPNCTHSYLVFINAIDLSALQWSNANWFDLWSQFGIEKMIVFWMGEMES